MIDILTYWLYLPTYLLNLTYILGNFVRGDGDFLDSSAIPERFLDFDDFIFVLRPRRAEGGEGFEGVRDERGAIVDCLRRLVEALRDERREFQDQDKT